MNRLKKRIIVRFFSIKANDAFFDDLVSIHNANRVNDKNVRIINIRNNKHLIKMHGDIRYHEEKAFFLSVIKERNTWQVRVLSDGKVSGIPLNQGIIGDPYYFLVIPRTKTILGFTTGQSGSLKNTAISTLQQFNKDRTAKITIEPLSKEKEFSKLKKLSGYNKLFFKVDPSLLDDSSEETPDLLRQLSSAPFMMGNSELALTFTDIGANGFSENDLIDIVEFLAEDDGCSALTVQGTDNDGLKVHLDFSKAYVIFKTNVEIRNKFIDEEIAIKVLTSALESVDMTTLSAF